VVAIILALLSAIANFLWLPYYPCRSLLIVAVEVFVIWAIAAKAGRLGSDRSRAHGREGEKGRPGSGTGSGR
jgi:hypothetical protein